MKKQQNREERISETKERIFQYRQRISHLQMEISSLQDLISDLNGDLSMLLMQKEKGKPSGNKEEDNEEED